MSFSFLPHVLKILRTFDPQDNKMCSFSPDRVCVRGASGAGAGGHGDGEAGRVPHLRRLLTARN